MKFLIVTISSLTGERTEIPERSAFMDRRLFLLLLISLTFKIDLSERTISIHDSGFKLKCHSLKWEIGIIIFRSYHLILLSLELNQKKIVSKSVDSACYFFILVSLSASRSCCVSISFLLP